MVLYESLLWIFLFTLLDLSTYYIETSGHCTLHASTLDVQQDISLCVAVHYKICWQWIFVSLLLF